MRILVVGPSWVGDTVLAQPMLQRLHQRFVGLQLDVLGPPWTLALLRRMPQVREALCLDVKHGEFDLLKRLKLGGSLRARRYEQAIVLPNSWKSALVPWSAGIEQRTGFVGEWRFGLLNDWRRLDKGELPGMAQRFCALAEDKGAKPQPAMAPLSLRVSPDNQRRLRQHLGLTSNKPVACLCPGAEYGPAKRWPAPHFAELARVLERRGMQVWLMGSSKDAALGAEIASLSQGAARNLCGETALDDAIDLMAQAQMVVSNDSGLMHVAAALQRPLLALYGSSSPAFTPPHSPFATVIKDELPCSPCFKRSCPLGHFDCLTKLTPARLLPHLDRLLSAKP